MLLSLHALLACIGTCIGPSLNLTNPEPQAGLTLCMENTTSFVAFVPEECPLLTTPSGVDASTGGAGGSQHHLERSGAPVELRRQPLMRKASPSTSASASTGTDHLYVKSTLPEARELLSSREPLGSRPDVGGYGGAARREILNHPRVPRHP